MLCSTMFARFAHQISWPRRLGDKPLPEKVVSKSIQKAYQCYAPDWYCGTIHYYANKQCPGISFAAWRLTAREVVLRIVPGRHDSMFDEPHIVELAKILIHDLERISNDANGEGFQEGENLMHGAGAGARRPA